jgi:hypothetical protein
VPSVAFHVLKFFGAGTLPPQPPRTRKTMIAAAHAEQVQPRFMINTLQANAGD